VLPDPVPEAMAPELPPPSTPPPLPTRNEPSFLPKPSSPPPNTVEDKMILLASREENPNAASPIHFRERMYAIPDALNAGTGEKLATKLLRTVQDDMAEDEGAKFIRIELFDHIWQDKPERPPVVRLEWKDWKPSIDIDFPLQDESRPSEAPKASSVPPPSDEDRLALAFEACHDLLFMKNRAEALEFAVHLMEELIPSEAAAAFLLDVNTDEFRVVAARGTGARARQGQAYPSTGGLLGAASALAEHAVLVLADAAADPRYDEDIDGVPGMDVRSLLYRPLIHRGRLFGLIQLANGLTDGMFTESDCEVVDYITQQLSTFVAQGTSRTGMKAVGR
jgi:GAF domain-containing protein